MLHQTDSLIPNLRSWLPSSLREMLSLNKSLYKTAQTARKTHVKTISRMEYFPLIATQYFKKPVVFFKEPPFKQASYLEREADCFPLISPEYR